MENKWILTTTKSTDLEYNYVYVQSLGILYWQKLGRGGGKQSLIKKEIICKEYKKMV